MNAKKHVPFNEERFLFMVDSSNQLIYHVDDVFPTTSIASTNYQKRQAAENELQRLIESPGILIVTGRSGIGKSSLTRHVTSKAGRRIFITQVDSDTSFEMLAQRALAGLVSKLSLFDPIRPFHILLKLREAGGVAWKDDTTSTDRLRKWLWSRSMLWIVERTERMNDDCEQGMVRFLNDLHDHAGDRIYKDGKPDERRPDPAIVCLSLKMHSSPLGSNQEDRFKNLKIEPMSLMEVRQVVTEGLNKMGVRYSTHCVEEIYQVSRGVPLAISKVLNTLLRQMGIELTVNQPGLQIGSSDVGDIAVKLGTDLRNSKSFKSLSALYGNSNSFECRVVNAVVRVGHKGNLKAIIEHGRFSSTPNLDIKVLNVLKKLMGLSDEQGYFGFELSGADYEFRKPFLFEALRLDVK
jgi:hypothetical protein